MIYDPALFDDDWRNAVLAYNFTKPKRRLPDVTHYEEANTAYPNGFWLLDYGLVFGAGHRYVDPTIT